MLTDTLRSHWCKITHRRIAEFLERRKVDFAILFLKQKWWQLLLAHQDVLTQPCQQT